MANITQPVMLQRTTLRSMHLRHVRRLSEPRWTNRSLSLPPSLSHLAASSGSADAEAARSTSGATAPPARVTVRRALPTGSINANPLQLAVLQPTVSQLGPDVRLARKTSLVRTLS